MFHMDLLTIVLFNESLECYYLKGIVWGGGYSWSIGCSQQGPPDAQDHLMVAQSKRIWHSIPPISLKNGFELVKPPI